MDLIAMEFAFKNSKFYWVVLHSVLNVNSFLLIFFPLLFDV